MERPRADLAAGLTNLRDYGARYIDYRTAWRAALFLGVVVWAINWPHGPFRALPAALKQAGYTFFIAGFIVRLCENLALGVGPRAAALVMATAVPTAIAVGLTFLVHSLKGTPEPLQSTLPTILLAPPSFAVWGWRSRAGREAVTPAPRNNEPCDRG